MNNPDHAEDLEGMLGKRPWPNWPLLPLKKWENGRLQSAFIYDAAPDENLNRWTVYEFNLFLLDDEGDEFHKQVPPDKQHHFSSPEAILEAGWRVD